MHKVKVKPLSVNEAWRGRRFKTDKYKTFEFAVLVELPNIKLPDPPFRVIYEFGFSSSGSDWDNPIKMTSDILSKHYGFNDNLIYEGIIRKRVVPKGKEYFSFKIEHLEMS